MHGVNRPHFRIPSVAGLGLLLILCAGIAARAEARPLVDYVNTLRGSDSSPDFSRGNTFPAVAVPFGFNFWTPITEIDSESWLYTYAAHHITGFGVSHEPSPWIGDHGSFQILPLFANLRVSGDERRTPFSHTNETARAHYYAVELPAEGITVEITPTDHASKWRLAFRKPGDAYLVFSSIRSAAGDVSFDQAAQTMQGFVDQNGPRLYFFAHLEHPIVAAQSVHGSNMTGWVKFHVSADEKVELAVATSFIGVAQARSNLEREIGAKPFDDIKLQAAAAWERLLNRVEIVGATEAEKVTFYSNLYRALLYPNSMWESVNGHAKYFSPYTRRLRDGKVYVNNGFWDTYRAQWPLLSVLVPGETAQMLEGFVNAYRDGGWVPRWSGPGYVDCMVGSNSDIVFADAYLRGVTEFDLRTAYASMLKNALVYSSNGAVGRKGNDRSTFRPYVPSDRVAEATAWTLEDTINDFGIAQAAKILGDEVHHEYFLNRARRYVDSYSSAVGFFRGKRSTSEWRTPDTEFDAAEWGHEFAEGNAWHYSVAVTTDPEGMAWLFGGRQRLSDKIDAVFSASAGFKTGSYGQVIHEMREAQATGMGQYAHSNEPLHSMIYLYDYAGAPAKAAQRVRRVLTRLYDSGVNTGRGYLGDEDNGQMSAWYVFSALGFYPASPGHPEYAIGSPLFKRATLHLENGRDFTVSAPENSERNLFVQSATLNGVPYTKAYLPHDVIFRGGLLELKLGPAPSDWGTRHDDVPSSITQGNAVPTYRSDVATRGVATAHPPGPNDVAAVFDDDSATLWSVPAHSSTIQYCFANGVKHAVSLYTMTSAKDRPQADPRDWQLEASDDGKHWQTLDRRSKQQFTWRQQTRVYSVQNRVPFACYRFNIEANQEGNLTQVAKIELIGEPEGAQ
jgi:predicted alpha-1,2-mannosidase